MDREWTCGAETTKLAGAPVRVRVITASALAMGVGVLEVGSM